MAHPRRGGGPAAARGGVNGHRPAAIDVASPYPTPCPAQGHSRRWHAPALVPVSRTARDAAWDAPIGAAGSRRDRVPPAAHHIGWYPGDGSGTASGLGHAIRSVASRDLCGAAPGDGQCDRRREEVGRSRCREQDCRGAQAACVGPCAPIRTASPRRYNRPQTRRLFLNRFQWYH
jgi:hypothetical protein